MNPVPATVTSAKLTEAGITASEHGLEQVVVTTQGKREAGVQLLGGLVPALEVVDRCALDTKSVGAIHPTTQKG